MTSVSSSSPRCFKSSKQCRDRLVDRAGQRRVIFLELAVRVPAVFVGHVVELHEAHAALDEPPREQAFATEAARRLVFVLETVASLGQGCFLVQVADFECARLHAVRELVAGQTRIELGESFVRLAMAQIQFTDQDRATPAGRRQIRPAAADRGPAFLCRASRVG